MNGPPDTTASIRSAYALRATPRPEMSARFDRWLAAHDAELMSLTLQRAAHGLDDLPEETVSTRAIADRLREQAREV